MILSKDPNLTLELDIHKISRDELRWINRHCNTEIIDELVEKIMEYNEGLTKEFKQSKIISDASITPKNSLYLHLG